MNEKIEIYKQLESELQSTLEAQYQYFMLSGDISNAYEVFGKLMGYRLISPEDERVSQADKIFKCGGFDPKHRFKYDYRKSVNYLADWLFSDLPSKMHFDMQTNPYWGKRVEGNYSGDVVFKARNIKLRISLVTTIKSAESAATSIAYMCKVQKKKCNANSVREELCSSTCKVYEVEVENGAAYNYKTVGYVYIYMSKITNAVAAKMFINAGALLAEHLDICKVVSSIRGVLTESIEGLRTDAVKSYFDYTKELELERTAYKDYRNACEYHEKLHQRLVENGGVVHD